MSTIVSSPKLRLQGPWRRVVYVGLFELIAIVATSFGLAAMTGESAAHSSFIAAATSAVAVVWNVVWNGLFERWEARQAQRGRSLWRRIAHAMGMEGGLVVLLVPLLAWWFEVSLWQAFLMDLGLLLFFLVYTFIFNWAFDQIFGLPTSAQAKAQPTA